MNQEKVETKTARNVMTIKALIGTASVMAMVLTGCNQENSEENGSQDNIENQGSQTEQNEMPDQNKQNPDLLQQSPKATAVSDSELKQFAVVAQKVQLINQNIQQKMINVLEKEGLDIQRYNEIQQAQQNPQQEVDVTKKEQGMLEASTREFQKLQGQAQQEAQTIISEAGLSMDRYEEIAMAIQSDPDLQNKFQSLRQ